jgi:hypothetical protein
LLALLGVHHILHINRIRVKKKSLEWIGHVARMDQGRTVKKIFESKLVGTR